MLPEATSFGLACNYPAVGLRLVRTQLATAGAMKTPPQIFNAVLNHSTVRSLGPFPQKCNLFLLAQMVWLARPKSRVCGSRSLRATIVKGKCVW